MTQWSQMGFKVLVIEENTKETALFSRFNCLHSTILSNEQVADLPFLDLWNTRRLRMKIGFETKSSI